MSRVVVLTGGPPHAHDFAATGRALAGLAEAQGHDVELFDHPDDAAARLGDGVDALVVNALRWRMAGDIYDEWRDDWSYTTPAATRDAVAAFVSAGGGLLASHTATICFDDWPGWGDVVGGAWRWGVSAHPPAGRVTVEVGAPHPVTADLPARFDLVDEVYGDLDVRDGVDVLAVARRSADDAPQPVVWTHRYGSGRVVYDAFGHDVASLVDPEHARLLRQSLAWITERDR